MRHARGVRGVSHREDGKLAPPSSKLSTTSTSSRRGCRCTATSGAPFYRTTSSRASSPSSRQLLWEDTVRAMIAVARRRCTSSDPRRRSSMAKRIDAEVWKIQERGRVRVMRESRGASCRAQSRLGFVAFKPLSAGHSTCLSAHLSLTKSSCHQLRDPHSGLRLKCTDYAWQMQRARASWRVDGHAGHYTGCWRLRLCKYQKFLH